MPRGLVGNILPTLKPIARGKRSWSHIWCLCANPYRPLRKVDQSSFPPSQTLSSKPSSCYQTRCCGIIVFCWKTLGWPSAPDVCRMGVGRILRKNRGSTFEFENRRCVKCGPKVDRQCQIVFHKPPVEHERAPIAGNNKVTTS